MAENLILNNVLFSIMDLIILCMVTRTLNDHQISLHINK